MLIVSFFWKWIHILRTLTLYYGLNTSLALEDYSFGMMEK